MAETSTFNIEILWYLLTFLGGLITSIAYLWYQNKLSQKKEDRKFLREKLELLYEITDELRFELFQLAYHLEDIILDKKTQSINDLMSDQIPTHKIRLIVDLYFKDLTSYAITLIFESNEFLIDMNNFNSLLSERIHELSESGIGKDEWDFSDIKKKIKERLSDYNAHVYIFKEALADRADKI